MEPRNAGCANATVEPSRNEPAVRRYAIVIVIEAKDPEEAWEATSAGLEGNHLNTMPEVVYVGAPWHGVPIDADGLSTEELALGMCLAEGPRFLPLTVALTPCDPAVVEPTKEG